MVEGIPEPKRRRASALVEGERGATPSASSGVFGGGISADIGEDEFLNCGEENLRSRCHSSKQGLLFQMKGVC